jgi:hypothetical protein
MNDLLFTILDGVACGPFGDSVRLGLFYIVSGQRTGLKKANNKSLTRRPASVIGICAKQP